MNAPTEAPSTTAAPVDLGPDADRAADPERRYRLILAAVVLGALVLRLVWVLAFQHIDELFGDAIYYHFQANELSEGQREKCVEEEPPLIDRGNGHPAACHYAEALTLL